MVSEVDEFWNNLQLDSKHLQVDYENLNGIAIYCALKTAIPILLVDILFIENFVSKSVLSTNRAYFMTVLHGAMHFLEDGISAYYEQKDNKTPLRTNFTPKFHPEESLLNQTSSNIFKSGMS
jgi:hypothetical protein